MERTIQEGDAFANVCGPKKPRGRVRVLGLGPTPQEVGTPGVKCYMPTRLQMEILARKKLENEKTAIVERMDQMQAQMDRMEQAMKTMSQHGSNSRPHVETHDNGGGHDESGEEQSVSADDRYDMEGDLLVHRNDAGPSVPRKNITSTRNNAACNEHDALIGKDVVLFAILRSDQPVAKATIISTNPKTILGGEALGRQYCEVVINDVLKGDAILPRPYSYIETMVDAHRLSIAWPYKKMKVSMASPSSHNTTAGTAGHGNRLTTT